MAKPASPAGFPVPSNDVWKVKSRVEALYPDFPHLDISSPTFDIFNYGARVQQMLRDANIPITPYPVTWSNLTCSVPVEPPQLAIATVVSGISSLASTVVHGCASGNTDGQAEAQVLSRVSGYVKPGELCLVLGASGSGVSLLLSRIAGRDMPRLVHTEGTVLYGGEQRLAGVLPRHIVHYVGQDDTHIPNLTVRQTFEFAAACKWPSWAPHVDVLRHNDVVLSARMLGIERTLDTVVGSDILRGVSGGERKRVTIGEMAMGIVGGIIAMDNWSKGLDSATTLSITTSMRKYADALQGSAIVSMQAPGTEVFNLFDTLCLLDQGRVLYFGPRAEAESYLVSLGFHRPPHRSVPDFVSTITDPHFLSEYMPSGVASGPVPPTTIAEFADRFEQSAQHAKVENIISDLNGQEHLHIPPESEKVAKIGQKSTIQAPHHQISALLQRQKNFLLSTRRTVFADMFQNIFLGVVLGSIFWQLPNTRSGASSRDGVIFLALLFIGLSSLAKVHDRYEEKVVFTKQRAAGFYDAWTFLLTQACCDFFLELVKTACLFVPLYVMAGLNLGSSIQRLLYAILVATFQSLIMISLVRFFVGLLDDPDMAQGVAGLFTILMVLSAGYMKNGSELQDWLVWIYWASPLHYSLEALLINEFEGLDFRCTRDELLPSFDGIPDENRVCLVSSGIEYLRNFRGITNGKEFRAYYFLVVVGFNVFFFILSALSTALSKPKGFARKTAVSEIDHLKKDVAIKVEESAPLSNTTFTFTNMTYSVSDGSKVLLTDVTGNAVSGSLVCLMGESGAGKTTLLDVCAMRKTLKGGSSVSGEIRINGRLVSKEELAHSSGYCEQNDLHVGEATVYEAVLFSAKLRLPQSVTTEEKVKRTQETLTLLGMEQYSSLLVKALGRGEMKLLTMALEVVANPNVLFLDEPTSGLSSSNAITVVQALRKIADSGTAVICTVHQPSAEVFSMFDRLLLLKRGGKTVYFGDIGEQAGTLRKYFESHGGRTMGVDENAASWMLEVIDDESIDWHMEWTRSEERRRADEETQSLATDDEGGGDVSSSGQKKFDSPSLKIQIVEVVKRQFWRYWRLPEYNVTRVILNFMIALMVGLLFLQEIDNSQRGANLAFAAMFLTIIPASLAASNVIPPTVSGRAVFYRETASETYRPIAYNVAVGLVEVPFTVVATTVFSVVFYFLVGLSGDRFFFFFLAIQLIYIMSVMLGVMLASVVPSAAIAENLQSSLFSVLNVLSGFFIRKSSIPVWWRWTVWINPYAYYLSSVIQNQLNRKEFECLEQEYIPFSLPNGTASCSVIDSSLKERPMGETVQCLFCPIENGDVLIEDFGADDVNKWVSLLAIFGILLVLRIVAGFGFAKLRFLTR